MEDKSRPEHLFKCSKWIFVFCRRKCNATTIFCRAAHHDKLQRHFGSSLRGAPVRRVSCVGRWAVGGVHQPMAPLLRLSDSTPELNKYVAPACPWSSAGQTEEGGGGAREGGVGEERVEAQSGKEWSKPDWTSSSWARGGWCREKLKRWNDGLIRRQCSVFMFLLFGKPAQNSTVSVREDVKIQFALVWHGDEDSELLKKC